MKIHLDSSNRLRRRELSDNLEEIRKTIYQEVDKKFRGETKELRAERDRLFDEEKGFQDTLKQMFRDKHVGVGSKVKVITQVGPNGGEILNTYIGKIVHDYNHGSVCFDLSDPNVREGKKFTIGGSCIQSLEIIEEDQED